MNEGDAIHIERNTIFVLAGLLLAAIVSIAFYNLDRHPAFPPPSQEFLDHVDDTRSSVVFTDDPLSMGVLEQHQSDLRTTIYPLTSWPPEAPIVTFGPVPNKYAIADMELVAEESVWSLWRPADYSPIPFFGTATVEVVDRDGAVRSCPIAVEGGHQCGDHSWTRVRHRDVRVDGELTECIWAHPLRDETLRIRFPNVASIGPEGERLRILTGLRDSAVGTGVPVDFEVRLGHRSIVHRHRDRRGWQSSRVPAVDEPNELIVDISTEDSGRRHTCFRFELR